MRIVRPYGSSRSKQVAGKLRRVLVEKTEKRAEHDDIPKFARSHDELVIAQWISTIDKIASKPDKGKRPTPEQRDLRTRLGNACWQQMTADGHLPGADSEARCSLAELWWSKIHPYQAGTEQPQPDRKGIRHPPRIKGRWYERFAGDVEPGQADTVEIAARIEEHLHQREYRLHPAAPPRRRGKIEARAESIGRNVLQARTDEDLDLYRQVGDPVLRIYHAALDLEKDGKRVTLPVAAEELFRHWSNVFRDPATDDVLTIERARATYPRMFALHMQIKQCYSQLLKRSRKDTREHRKPGREGGPRLSALLPRNIGEALRLAEAQNGNAELSHLVRLGKIIHYAASDGALDRPDAIGAKWPDKPDESRFWTSDGQAEIKRAEAFVRIWRHAIVLASLTLKDWVSMKRLFKGDILGGGGQVDQALKPELFDGTKFTRKLRVLFGSRADLLELGSDADCLDFLRGLIRGTESLRHAVFHFKGRGQFVDKLAELPQACSAPVTAAAQRLWQKDAEGRAARLKAVLAGAHAETYLTAGQATTVLDLLTRDVAADLPLPRFSRLLERASNAWSEDPEVRLPAPANRRALEAPKRLCQYTVLKLLYEGPFKAWLEGQDTQRIAAWIDRAVARSTEAARAQDPGREAGMGVIAARAAKLPRPQAGSDIRDFFFDLSAASASEMRVQRGYESDGEKAREQAEYIDHLLRDVVILGFGRYIAEETLAWAYDIDPAGTPPEHTAYKLEEIPEHAAELVAEDWQAALYLMLHLLPVEAVGRLLHQLARWESAAAREGDLEAGDAARLKRLVTTLTLYLDMHDAKFEGGDALDGCEDFRKLFEKRSDFDQVFCQVSAAETERRVPRRGLREIARFGHFPLLWSLCDGAQIDSATVRRVFEWEDAAGDAPSRIAQAQKAREDLHADWVKNSGLEPGKVREYCDALATVYRHRHDANRVNLVDHVRVHRIVMAVLGRLVDYSGLFERDLYFVTLALLHEHGLHPDAFFSEEGRRYLANGQIIFALRTLTVQSGTRTARVLNALRMHFGEVWTGGNAATNIRNNLAHLNMLQGRTPPPRLTHWVNETRQLMAYDRKLKNAVSKSVMELLEREGFDLSWTMQAEDDAHHLTNTVLAVRHATHLGKTRLPLPVRGDRRPWRPITEPLHSDGCVRMIAKAFEGEVRPERSIIELLPSIEWAAMSEPRKPPR